MVLETNDASVYFEPSLNPAAREIARIYPVVKSELASMLLWKVDFRPTVILVAEHDIFTQMAGGSLFVAYAVPEKMLIVIDYSKMNTEPFTLQTTLKHELCHLLLHARISPEHLPKWLDEGVCQWASGGFAELVTGRSRSALTWAALSGRFLPLDTLSTRFPEDGPSITLAYEESRSLVEYIVETYGVNGILTILEALSHGNGVNDAISMSLGTTLEELEKRWRRSQQGWVTLISYLAGNIYTFIFVLAALLSIAVYLRVLIKKRRFKDEEDDTFIP